MPTAKNTSAQQIPPVSPAVGQQPIRAGSETIQRPTTNTSTNRTLKEGKV
jgi:hypothetical protein